MHKALALLLLATPVAAIVWHALNEIPSPLSLRERGTAGEDSGISTVVRDTDTTTALRVPPLGGRCGGHCGTERWEVKTLSDPDRDLVDLRPVDATVEDLIEVQPESIAPGGYRYAPVELTVYQVEAYLGGAFTENDGDWHLVLFGLENQRASIIAEIPDPACAGACRSGLARDFAIARQALEDRLAEPNPQDRAIRVTVTGVGFFDRPHGQAGAAPNQFELHPVLRIEFPNDP